jgi:hypothetical protein
MADKIEIFFSYAYEDEEDRKLCNEIEKQLGPLKREGLIEVWHRGKINPGEEPDKVSSIHLNQAHILLLLISASFIASDYYYNVEMKRAMERHDADEARVIPILLSPFDWKNAPFAQLEVLPSNHKPLTRWSNIDEAIVEIVEELRRVVEKLREPRPEGPVDSNQLYEALLRLDYSEQTRVFRQFKDTNHSVGAFLIYGAPSSGQGWLMNRLLVKQVPGVLSAKPPFHFSFERKACGIALKNLLRELARWAGLKYTYLPKEALSPEEIAERVHQLWQTQSIILILSSLHEIEEGYIHEFLQKFWFPLVELAQKKPAPSPSRYILLFLVDNVGSVDKWRIPVTTQVDQAWEPRRPIKLRKLRPFTRQVLNEWIEREYETFGNKLTVQDILDNSYNGIPEGVLEHICGVFGYNWSALVKYRV